MVPDLPDPQAENIPRSGHFELYNVGESNARIQAYWFETYFGEGLPSEAPYAGKAGVTEVRTLRPGESFRIPYPSNGEPVDYYRSYAEIVSAREGLKKGESLPAKLKTIFVVGWVKYLDELDAQTSVGFCRKYNIRNERFEREPDPDYEYGQ